MPGFGEPVGGSAAGRIARRRLSTRMKGLQECDESGGFCGTKILAIRRHIPPTLNNLANHLIFGLYQRDLIESGSAFASLFTQGVAIVALLELKYESALAFQGRSILQKF